MLRACRTSARGDTIALIEDSFLKWKSITWDRTVKLTVLGIKGAVESNQFRVIPYWNLNSKDMSATRVQTCQEGQTWVWLEEVIEIFWFDLIRFENNAEPYRGRKIN